MDDSMNSEKPIFSPEELHEIELETPAIYRKDKIEARRDLTERLKDRSKAGGIKSPLDPVNPHKLREFGEPTDPIGEKDISKPGKN